MFTPIQLYFFPTSKQFSSDCEFQRRPIGTRIWNIQQLTVDLNDNTIEADELVKIKHSSRSTKI